MLFSIIIPTYNRSSVLEHSIKTVLSQNYEDFELIVSDNHSHDNTANLVKSINDERLVYTTPPKHCCMAKNWEHALSKARGKYIFFLGDDDGLVKNGLTQVAKLVELYEPHAISWRKVDYNWPNSAKKPNIATISLEQKIYKMRSLPVLFLIAKGLSQYAYLPTLYNSFISAKVINRVKERSKENKFFHSNTPDIYSGIVCSSVIDNYLFCEQSFSITGSSALSNGNSIAAKGTRFKEFFDNDELPWNDKIQAIAGVIDSSIAESYLQAYEQNLTRGISLNERLYLKRIKKKIQSMSRSDLKAWALEKLKGYSIVNKNEILDLTKPTGLSEFATSKKDAFQSGYNEKTKELVVSCDKFKIENIYDFYMFLGSIIPLVNIEKVPVNSFFDFLLIKMKKKLIG